MAKYPDSARPYVSALLMVSKAFRENNIDFVLIGSLILPLAYRIEWGVHDVDLFIMGRSAMVDEDLFREIARVHEWDVGLTAFGGLYYEVVVDGEVVRVDLMENLLDVYVPQGLIDDSMEIDVDGERIRAIRLEGLIVLKAREATDEAEEFLERLSSIIAEEGIDVDEGRMIRYIEMFPEDERDSIRHRIEISGIYLE